MKKWFTSSNILHMSLNGETALGSDVGGPKTQSSGLKIIVLLLYCFILLWALPIRVKSGADSISPAITVTSAVYPWKGDSYTVNPQFHKLCLTQVRLETLMPLLGSPASTMVLAVHTGSQPIFSSNVGYEKLSAWRTSKLNKHHILPNWLNPRIPCLLAEMHWADFKTLALLIPWGFLQCYFRVCMLPAS